MKRKKYKSRERLSEKFNEERKVNIFKKKSTFIIFILYFFVLLFIFAPVLTKPLNTPDFISQAYPLYTFNKAYFLKHFTLPFWFPYMSGGTPYLEGFHFNYLLDFFVYPLPIELSIGYREMLFVFLVGVFAYLFFKSMGFSVVVSAVSGLVYMISGNSITFTTVGHFGKIINMAFLPVAFMFINYAFTKKKIIYFLFCGFVVAFLYKGHPQIFYYNLIIVSIYFLFKLIFEYREKKDKALFKFAIIGFAIMGFTAVLLSSDNLFHQLQFVKMTSRGAEGDPIQKWQFATSWSKHPLELLTYIIPAFWGLQAPTYLGWKPFQGHTNYLGVIIFFIAIFGIITNWKNKYIKFFTFTSIFAAMFGFGRHFPLYYKLFYNYVPMIHSFRVPASIYIPVNFFIIYFFAYGLKSIIEFDYNKEKNRNLIIYFLVCILIVVILLTILFYSSTYKEIIKSNLGQKINLRELYSKYQTFQVDNYINSILSKTINIARNGIVNLWIFSASIIFILFLLSFKKIKVKTFLFLLIILTFIDLYIIDKKFIHSVDNYNIVSQETDVIRFLKKDSSKFRIIPFPPIIDNESNKWCLFDIESAFAYNPVALKIYDDIQKAGLLYNLKFLGLFNVKYLLAKKQYQDSNIEEVFRGRSKIVYKNKLLLPRAFFVRNYRVMTNVQRILNYLKSDEFEPTKEILLEEQPDITEETRPKLSSTDYVETVKYDLDKIVFKARINNPAFLLLSDVYYPKWQCFVNGKLTKIYKADYLFRAIYLKNGESEIVFRYKNNGTFLILFLFNLILTLGLIIFIIKNIKRYFY